MLLREQFRRRHQCGLAVGLHGIRCSERRHDRLAHRLVSWMGQVGIAGGCIGEVDGEAVEIAAFDLFGAFAATGMDGEDAGEFSFDRVEVGEDG